MNKEIKKVNISIFDVEELACIITGLDYDAIDADTEIIEDKLVEELNTDLCQFHEMISRLLPLIDVGRSPLTGERYKGFSNSEKQTWIIKTKI